MSAVEGRTVGTGYEAARSSAAWLERSDRGVFRMHGRDPVRMIQGLVTNDVAGAPEDRATYAVLLTPKGKMLADLRIIRRSDDVLLECDASASANVADTLKKFVPPLFARWEPLDDWRVLGVYGPASADVLGGAIGSALTADAAEHTLVRTQIGDADAFVVRTAYAGFAGWDVIAPAAVIDNVRSRLADAGVVELEADELDVLRIEAGSPRWGAELTEDTIPLEAGLRERAISETKGCYTGQEVIVRILHRGHVNWHLRGMLLGDVPPPARDTPLLGPEDGKKLGRITSACRSPVHGQTIALGYGRRELTLPAKLRLGRVDGPEVTVVELPFPT